MYTVITYSLSSLRRWRGCLLSAERAGASPAPVPSAAMLKKPENRKSETGTRLQNEAWSAAAREFLLAFGERGSGFFKPCP
ncbi:unnamed protein product, partial [Staurois parvus]